jgi:hypothetical protein
MSNRGLTYLEPYNGDVLYNTKSHPIKKEVQRGREVDNTNGSVKGFPHHIYVNIYPRVHIARWLMACPLIYT